MIKRHLTLLTLFFWAFLMLWFFFSGRVAAYLHPQFHAYVAFAGFTLSALAPLWWWASRDATGGCECCFSNDDNGHSQISPGLIFTFSVLLLPVAGAAIISPSQFGVAAVMNRGIVSDLSELPSASPAYNSWTDAPLVGDEGIPDVTDLNGEEGVEYFTRGADGAIQLETIDLLFAAEEPVLREQFENQRVSIIGQYIPPRGEKTGGFDLVRMFVVCCAADARPLGIKITTPKLIEVPRMGWVKITGVAKFETNNGRLEPRLEAESIEEVEAPRETFLY